MKKVLFAAAALGLGLGLAATDASAVGFSAAGKYMIEGRYVSNGADGSQPGKVSLMSDNEASDFMYHLLYTYPTVTINDKTRVKGEIRFIDRDVYGTKQSIDCSDPGDESDSDVYDGFSCSSSSGATNNNQNIWVRRLWAEWDTPYGTLHLGRMPGGAWGSNFLDWSNGSDRIKFVTNVMPSPFSLTFIWQKNSEKDGFTGATDEADSASWYAGVGHKADFGASTVALWHTRFDEDAQTRDSYSNTHLWINTAWKFNGFNLDTEWRYIFGETSNKNVDYNSLGVMANGYGNFGAATAGVLFFYLQGDDDSSDGDDEGVVGRGGVGNDYNPFLIATGDYTGLLNADKNGYWAANGITTCNSECNTIDPGALALAVWARYAASDKITLNAAFGRVWANEKPSGMDDVIGTEVDLGMSYKILPNLSYNLQGGYLMSGDLIEDLNDGSSEDVFMLLHSMTMTF